MAAVGKRHRGSNFSTEEETQLARSWMNISQDPIKGTGQKADTFWDRVEDHFNEHSSNDQEARRSSRSLQSK